MFLKNKILFFKIRRSKVTDYAALSESYCMVCGYVALLSYCTNMHVHSVHCEMLDVKHWNISQRCNNTYYLYLL